MSTPNSFLEEALAQQHLADQRLAAGDVGVGFHPHRALRFEAAFVHALFDLFIQVGVIFLHPLEELRLAGAKDIIGVEVHVCQRGGKGARAFALCLADGPQPAQVDVRVADGADIERRVAAALCQQRARGRRGPPGPPHYRSRAPAARRRHSARSGSAGSAANSGGSTLRKSSRTSKS